MIENVPIETIKKMVGIGLGVAFVPLLAVREERARGELAVVEVEGLQFGAFGVAGAEKSGGVAGCKSARRVRNAFRRNASGTASCDHAASCTSVVSGRPKADKGCAGEVAKLICVQGEGGSIAIAAPGN